MAEFCAADHAIFRLNGTLEQRPWREALCGDMAVVVNGHYDNFVTAVVARDHTGHGAERFSLFFLPGSFRRGLWPLWSAATTELLILGSH